MMGEETVVDRVARMLYEGAYERRFYPMCDWAKLSDGGRARWLDDAAAILNAVADAVERLREKPKCHHYKCWAGGTTLVLDAWGKAEDIVCPYYRANGVNCGGKAARDDACQGAVTGDFELDTHEAAQNWKLDEVVRYLRSAAKEH